MSDQKQYFDLHLHPLFKKHICQFDGNLPMTLRHADDLKGQIKLSNTLANIADDLILHIIRSQSSVKQCLDGKVQVAVAAIANLEFGFADSKGFISKILKGNLSNPLDKTFFEKVKNGEVSYFRLFLMELGLYKMMCQLDSNVQFVSRNGNRSLENNKTNLLLSLEGLHNICRLKVGNTLEEDTINYQSKEDFDKASAKVNDALWQSMMRFPTCPEDKTTALNPTLNFIDIYRKLSAQGLDIFYVTLTHLTHVNEQYIATHAFGMKMLKHPSFYPSGNGISNIGKSLIEACYNMKNHKEEARPILIDIKHLGLKSRQDLYALRKEIFEGRTLPLIASHMGVTGYSINEWKNAIKRENCKMYTSESVRAVSVETTRKSCGKWGSFLNNDFSFNPWSINMMDEDIVEVLESGGIIGMSLDVRILGFQAEIGLNFAGESEFLSTSDFQTHFPDIGIKNLPVKPTESMVSETESWLVPTKEDRHPLAFCFNIVHIVNTALLKTDIKEPWLQICIGSDFDGLIEPLKISPDISSLQELETNMLRWLPVADAAYMKENGGPGVFKNMDGAILKKVVRGIMHENGKRFVESWLKDFGTTRHRGIAASMNGSSSKSGNSKRKPRPTEA